MTITNSAPASALKEAQETAAQTQAEASKGDQQAIRKLASATPPTPPANVVNSDRGTIDATA